MMKTILGVLYIIFCFCIGYTTGGFFEAMDRNKKLGFIIGFIFSPIFFVGIFILGISVYVRDFYRRWKK